MADPNVILDERLSDKGLIRFNEAWPISTGNMLFWFMGIYHDISLRVAVPITKSTWFLLAFVSSATVDEKSSSFAAEFQGFYRFLSEIITLQTWRKSDTFLSRKNRCKKQLALTKWLSVRQPDTVLMASQHRS